MTSPVAGELAKIVELFQLAAIDWGAIPTKQVKQRLKATSRRANRFIKYIFSNTVS